jgi:hypothetical protein
VKENVTSHFLDSGERRFIFQLRIFDETRKDRHKVDFRFLFQNFLHLRADDVHFLPVGPDQRLRVGVHAFVHRCRSVLVSEKQIKISVNSLFLVKTYTEKKL